MPSSPSPAWASTEDSALFAALGTVPKPASVGDPNPLTIRDVKRDGKSTVLVDVVTPDASEVNLFVEGPTPDWALPVPAPVEHSPPGVKRFSFELDGLPPGTNPEGAALKLTLVGGDRSYEFNINLIDPRRSGERRNPYSAAVTMTHADRDLLNNNALWYGFRRSPERPRETES